METTWPFQLTVCSRLQVRANGNYVAVSTDGVFGTAGPGKWKLGGRFNRQCVPDSRSGRMETTWSCQLTMCSRRHVRANGNYVAVSTNSVFQITGPSEEKLRGRVNRQCVQDCRNIANGSYMSVSNDSVFQTAGSGEWKIRGRVK